ncbi:MAG: hypothetical protein J2P15_21415, partial [Micromonosporaceae bacterium]|nr:hypothetical protein [Micromonosporaceae bacterium]
MAELAILDLATVAARFGAALRAAGLPVGADRCERFARAILLVRPATTAQLRWCARSTLAGDQGQIELLDRVFDAVFGRAVPGGLDDPADSRGDQNSGEPVTASAPSRRTGVVGAGSPQAGGTVGKPP